jgi:hypothetical protein
LEKQPGTRVESDPLLAFSIESGGAAAAPSQLEQPVAAVRVPASAQSDRKTSDSADAMRARIDRLEKVVDRNTKEIAALKAQVATLVGARVNKRAATISAIVAVVVGVGFGAWLWTLMSNEPLPVIGKPPLAEIAIVHAASVTPTPEVQPRVLPPPPMAYVGTLSIDSDPPADVFIDRKPAGRTPMRAANLKAGAHLVWIERDGYRRFTRVVEVPANRISRVVADLEPVAQR